MGSYLSFVGKSFNKVFGTLGTIASIFLTWAVWYLAKDSSIPAWLAVLTWIVGTVVVATLIHASYSGWSQSVHPLPKALVCRAAPQDGCLMILLEPSRLFSFGIAVSIFLVNEDGFEQLLALGFVANVQEDEKIQIIVNHVQGGHTKEIKTLEQNNANTLRRLRVKPVAPMFEVLKRLPLGEFNE